MSDEQADFNPPSVVDLTQFTVIINPQSRDKWSNQPVVVLCPIDYDEDGVMMPVEGVQYHCGKSGLILAVERVAGEEKPITKKLREAVPPAIEEMVALIDQALLEGGFARLGSHHEDLGDELVYVRVMPDGYNLTLAAALSEVRGDPMAMETLKGATNQALVQYDALLTNVRLLNQKLQEAGADVPDLDWHIQYVNGKVGSIWTGDVSEEVMGEVAAFFVSNFGVDADQVSIVQDDDTGAWGAFLLVSTAVNNAEHFAAPTGDSDDDTTAMGTEADDHFPPPPAQ